MFDAFRLQLPQACHHSLLQHSLLSSFAFRRTPCPGVRRRAWAVRAAWSGSEKTEKEIAAHFAIFNRKDSGEDRPKHANGQNGQLKDCKHVLPLFTQYNNLPPDGKVLTEEEELCNPEERMCAVPKYVWERKCHACSGTGFVRSSPRSRRGRSTSGVCPTCIGLGASALFHGSKLAYWIVPELNNGSGPHFTMMRPKDEEEYDSE